MKQLKFIPISPDAEFDHLPPKPATTTLPQWYKDIPQFLDGEKKLRIIPGTVAVNSTVKRCTPFLDAMTAGYTIVLSEDVQVIKKGTNTNLWWRSSSKIITDHSQNQHPGLAIPAGYEPIVFKWANDWSISTPKGYSLLCTHPLNRFDLPFLVINGFVDTDTYPLGIQDRKSTRLNSSH